jgi:hypothetical protein
MATAKEIFESRSGMTQGTFGYYNVTRTFHVAVNAYDDIPQVTIQDRSIGGVVQGDPHPKIFGLFAAEFTAKRLTKLTHEVVVLYGSPLTFTFERPYWNIAFEADTETETLTHDLDGKPYGHPRFDTHEYDAALPGVFPIYETFTKEGKIQLTTRDPVKFPYFVRPFVRERMGGTVRLWRSFANFPFTSNAANWLSSVGAVNQDEVFVLTEEYSRSPGLSVGPKYHFKIKYASLEPAQGVIVGQRVPDRIWTAQMSLRYSPIAYHPRREQIVYVDDHGSESPIQYKVGGEPGAPVIENYRDYEFTSVTGLLANFGQSQRQPSSSRSLQSEGKK